MVGEDITPSKHKLSNVEKQSHSGVSLCEPGCLPSCRPACLRARSAVSCLTAETGAKRKERKTAAKKTPSARFRNTGGQNRVYWPLSPRGKTVADSCVTPTPALAGENRACQNALLTCSALPAWAPSFEKGLGWLSRTGLARWISRPRVTKPASAKLQPHN